MSVISTNLKLKWGWRAGALDPKLVLHLAVSTTVDSESQAELRTVIEYTYDTARLETFGLP